MVKFEELKDIIANLQVSENDLQDLKQLLIEADKQRFKNKTVNEVLEEYKASMVKQELSNNTMRDYLKEVERFLGYCEIKEPSEITQEKYLRYKDYLKTKKIHRSDEYLKRKRQLDKGYIEKTKISTINKSIIAVNRFLKFINFNDCCVKVERVQKASSREDVFTLQDYQRLVRVASQTTELKKAQKKLDVAEKEGIPKKIKLAKQGLKQAERNQARKYRAIHLIKSIFGTGIRDAEIEFLTVEALNKNQMVITNKNKTRTVPIPQWLKHDLRKYCKTRGITSGIIFHGQDRNKRLSHSQIWKDIQFLAGRARVSLDKAHEHSLRALFAKLYADENDIKSLQDILGHEQIATSLLYTQKSIKEQRDAMQKMKYIGRGKIAV